MCDQSYDHEDVGIDVIIFSTSSNFNKPDLSSGSSFWFRPSTPNYLSGG